MGSTDQVMALGVLFSPQKISMTEMVFLLGYTIGDYIEEEMTKGLLELFTYDSTKIRPRLFQ